MMMGLFSGKSIVSAITDNIELTWNDGILE
jgi:hypothetical protein